MSVPDKNFFFEKCRQADARLGVRSGKIVPWLLLAFALIYYALYFRSGLNLGGEGGTAGVVAMRLMEGQRPIVDTFLGYNVLWFFPIAWLFELTGPNYLVLRGFFFAICLVSAGLVYRVVFNYTKNAWFPAVPCVLAILIPGMMFRNYMPFLGVLNAWLLTSAFVRTSRRFLLRAAAAGVGLGITFLVRIDLGIFFTIILLGLALLYPLGARGDFWKRTFHSMGAVLVALSLAWAAHLPFFLHAKARGYDAAFLAQYTGWLEMVSAEFKTFTADLREKPPAPAPVSPQATTPKPTATTKAPAETWEDRGALARSRISDIWTAPTWEFRSLALSIYLPIPFSVVAIAVGLCFLLSAILKKDGVAKERALYPLTVLGCALTLFPQYFFFRPDTVHVAEMMVPFLAALATIFWAALRYAREQGSKARRLLAAIPLTACTGITAIYVSHALPKGSAGTVAAREKAAHRFDALNGVHVLVRQKEARWLAGLRDAILRHSSPREFVVCFPYSPTINFMTDRPSPLHNLYVDNATAGKRFTETFLKVMTESRPAVVVLDQRKINRSEASRFQNWAPEACRWLAENYVYLGRYDRNEVFARKDKVPGPVTPEAIEVRN